MRPNERSQRTWRLSPRICYPYKALLMTCLLHAARRARSVAETLDSYLSSTYSYHVFLYLRLCCELKVLSPPFSLFIHTYIILLNRPFIAPCASPSETSNLSADKAAAEAILMRQVRVTAFSNSRTAALQIMGLLRHVPPLSPCYSLPFLISTASTILLLTPRDLQAMDAVRAGLECLDAMYLSGFWKESARDARVRILGLAKRWALK